MILQFMTLPESERGALPPFYELWAVFEGGRILTLRPIGIFCQAAIGVWRRFSVRRKGDDRRRRELNWRHGKAVRKGADGKIPVGRFWGIFRSSDKTSASSFNFRQKMFA